MDPSPEISTDRVEPVDVATASPDRSRGVFETMLVAAGRVLEARPHIARLRASVRTLYGAVLPAAAVEAVEREAEGLALGRLRLTVAPGSARPEFAVSTAAVDRALVLPSWERALTLAPSPVTAGLGAHKWVDRDLVAALEAQAGPAVPLLVDGRGRALEVTRGNLFAVFGSVVVTPPLDGAILPGVTRAIVLDLAREHGLRVREQELELATLTSAAEVFVSGAVRGIEPVRACGGARWQEGPVGRALAEALRRRWSLA